MLASSELIRPSRNFFNDGQIERKSEFGSRPSVIPPPVILFDCVEANQEARLNPEIDITLIKRISSKRAINSNCSSLLDEKAKDQREKKWIMPRRIEHDETLSLRSPLNAERESERGRTRGGERERRLELK